MKKHCHSHCRDAYRASKPRHISGLAAPCSQALGSSQSALGGGSCTTALTSMPGSMSIRVEGGP